MEDINKLAQNGKIKHTSLQEIPFTYVFNGIHSEILRLEPNGDIYVKGNLVENDKEVVNGMRYLIEKMGGNKND